MSIVKEEPTENNMESLNVDTVSEEPAVDTMDPAMAAAHAIAQFQASIAAAASGTNFDDDDDMVGMPHDMTLAVSPESMNDADSGVETKSVDIKSEMDADSGDEVPPHEPAANARVLDVRCGSLTGKLYEERFTCPGIHKKCIEYEGRLISPRQFTIRAEKDKQKDWKGSIRVGRYNLRTLMEMKKIDFYEHESNCSLKCQSRNYIKNRKQAAMENSMSFLDSLVKNGAALSNAANELNEQQPSSSTSFCTDFDENGYNSSRKGSEILQNYARMSTSSSSSSTIEPALSTPTPAQNSNQVPDPAALAQLQMLFKNFQPAHFAPQPIKQDNDVAALLTQLMEQQKGVNNNFGVQNANTPVPQPQEQAFLNNGETLNGPTLKKIMEQQPAMFWERMREMNLFDVFVDEMSRAVEQLKAIQNGGQHYAAQKLSNVALTLDLSDEFARKIQANYVQTALQAEIQRKAAEEKRMQDAAKAETLKQFCKLYSNMDPALQHLLAQHQQQQLDMSNKMRLGI
uniref:SAND domain-containing protein n=1 Tax=Panagrellus redivivus TaxID=6233 RepID=A0A7E4ULL1_PANRE